MPVGSAPQCREGGVEHPVGVVEGLRDDPGVGDHGHEVGVALPTRYHVDMQVIAPRGGVEIRFDGTQITNASVLYRSYTASSTPAALLPAAQAAACLPKGGTLRLLYAEGTGGELTAGWETE